MARKICTAVALVVATALTLAGCSSNGGQSATSGGSTKGGAGVAAADHSAEITYAFWDALQRPAIEKNIQDFNKLYPNIKVTINLTPWAQYWTKLQTQAESNTLSDVFWINGPNIALYGANGMLEPIDALVESGHIDPANYLPTLNEIYTVNGTQYAVPKDFDTIGLWYNKALFAKAGVELPTAEWTRDDFQKAANDISAALKGEGIYGVASPLYGQQTYYNSIIQAGGEVISADKKTSGFDSEAGIRGLGLWAELVASGASPTPQQFSDTNAVTMFDNGKAAMCWTGTFSVSQFLESPNKDDFEVTFLPKDERQATVIHGLANAVAAGSQNKEAANAFAAYLGSEEAQRTQAEMGIANPAFNGTQQAFLDTAPNWNLQSFLDSAKEHSFAYPVSLNTQAWMELETTLLPPMFAGERPVEEVAKELASKMNAILEAE